MESLMHEFPLTRPHGSSTGQPHLPKQCHGKKPWQCFLPLCWVSPMSCCLYSSVSGKAFDFWLLPSRLAHLPRQLGWQRSALLWTVSGDIFPSLGLYPELYFHYFVFQSSTAKWADVRLEVTGAYEQPHKTKGPCDTVPQVQQWPPRHPEGAQGKQLLVPPQSLLHYLPSWPGSSDFTFNNNSQ